MKTGNGKHDTLPSEVPGFGEKQNSFEKKIERPMEKPTKKGPMGHGIPTMGKNLFGVK